MEIKAKPGTKLVKNPATGKYRMVPVKGAKSGTSGASVAKPDTFVQDEINRQIEQDQGLTNFTDNATGNIASQMAEQSRQAADLAARYKPTATYHDPMLDTANTSVLDAGAAQSNSVNQDQANSIAKLIAAQSAAGSTLLGNMRGAGQVQHRDYARYLQGLKPSLDLKHTQELSAAQSQKLQDAYVKQQTDALAAQTKLAYNQFGASLLQNQADNAYRNSALTASQNAAAAKAKAGKSVPLSTYGYGIPKSYEAGINAIYSSVADKVIPQETIDPATGKKTGQVKNVPNGARRWKDTIQKLTGLGIHGGQAVLLASKWMPERLTIHGENSPQVIYDILKNGKLGFKVSDAVAKQVFNFAGLDWKKRTAPMRIPMPTLGNG